VKVIAERLAAHGKFLDQRERLMFCRLAKKKNYRSTFLTKEKSGL